MRTIEDAVERHTWTTGLDDSVARLVDQREDQGLPRAVEDPETLRRLATLAR